MRRQRGMIPITWLLGGIAALVATAAIGWVVNNYHKGVRAQATLEAIGAELQECPREVKAKGVVECVKAVKATLADCRDRYAITLDQISKQNAAVIKLGKAEQSARAAAAAAQRKADEQATANLAQREYYDAKIKSGNPAGVCPADQAVADVKRGMKP